MRLMLLRHAKSEKAEGGMRDRDRPLNPRGRNDAAMMGDYMMRHRLLPDRVLVSPARRARETWERLAEKWPARPPVDFADDLYGTGPDAILGAIKQTDPSTHTLLVIGHNPGLHDAANLLVASGDVDHRELLNESLPTTGLAAIDFVGDDWRQLHAHGGRLERFVTPRSLKPGTK